MCFGLQNDECTASITLLQPDTTIAQHQTRVNGALHHTKHKMACRTGLSHRAVTPGCHTGLGEDAGQITGS